MDIAPLAEDEASRLRILAELDVLDSNSEPEFDALAKAAALVCGTPIALISLIDIHRQWFKATVGLPDAWETPRDIAFCSHAIMSDYLMEVPDARVDTRFSDNPLVTGDPGVRFYAGIPLRMTDGARIGTLCVLDRQPRRLKEWQRQTLEQLAVAVVHALERRRDARARNISESRYRALVDASPLGVFATDAFGGCTFTNEKWQTIFNLTEQQSLGFGWTLVIEPEDHNRVSDAWRRAAESGAEFDSLFRLRAEDGLSRIVHTRARSIRDGRGAVVGHVGTVEDISAQIASTLALDQERERLANILDSTRVSTWEWQVSTGVVLVNERWAENIGHTLEELAPVTQDTWASRVHPDDLEVARKQLAEHFSRRTSSYECQIRMRHRDGHWVWVLDRGRVISWNADGTPEWMFGTHTDISEIKFQAEELAKSQRFLQRTGALAGVGGWEADLATGIVTLSDQIHELLGIERGKQVTIDEVIAMHVHDAEPLVRDALARAIATGDAFDLELRFTTSTGTHLWAQVVGTVEVQDQYPLRLVGALRDITEQVEQRRRIDIAHERIALAAESGNVGIWDYDLNSDCIHWDECMYRMIGRTPSTDPLSLEEWVKYLHPEDRAATEQLVRSALLNRTPFSVQYRFVMPDDSLRFLQINGQVKANSNGVPQRLVGVCTDVTALRNLSDELAAERELLKVTLQSIGAAVVTTDGAGVVTWLNPAAERLTGWRLEESVGRRSNEILTIVHEETREPAESPIEHSLREGAIVELVRGTVLLSRDGEEYGIEDSAAPIRDSSGAILGVVMVFHDVSEQRRLSKEMTFRARHDPLTGLVNRAEFEARLARTLRRAHDQNSVHALMFIDLDQFKLVNDSCGHGEGDKLLQEVAKLFSDSVRSRDTVARLGGDEFGVILEYCAIDQAARVAQQICDRMDDFRFQHEGRRFRIGASVGLVPLDNRWADVTAAMQAADVSCYAAKENGRNRVHLWFDTDVVMQARQVQTQWVSRIESALEEDRFDLYVQRIEGVNVVHTGLHGEILLRMLDAQGQLILPGAFMPAAERYHLASRLDRWVLHRAIEALLRVPDLTAIDMLCVNLSGQSVGDQGFRQLAVDSLRDAGSAICGRICFEITETAAITNLSDAALFIAELRQLGVRIALDDFGAGASSFGYLKSLKVDFLKIDGQFISCLMDDPLDGAAVRCFVDVARVIGVRTIAEWVEKPEVLRCLGELGVDFAQGFLLHHPEPLAALLAAHVRWFDQHTAVKSSRNAVPSARRLISSKSR